MGADNAEQRLQDAVQRYQSGTSLSIRQVALDCHVPYATLHNRVHGIRNRRESHQHQQLLDNVQERVLVDWCEYHARMAIPLSRVQVAGKAAELAGRVPGKHWVERFLKKYDNLLGSSKGHGLDPKRAQAFNPTTVADHFTQLKTVMETFEIPSRNLYNWDEKGLQLGGGRKGLNLHYVFAQGQRERYVSRSDNLELVSLLEAVSADGYALPPMFVVSKTYPSDWWSVPGVGG